MIFLMTGISIGNSRCFTPELTIYPGTLVTVRLLSNLCFLAPFVPMNILVIVGVILDVQPIKNSLLLLTAALVISCTTLVFVVQVLCMF